LKAGSFWAVQDDVAIIVVAGGGGTRFGGAKQFAALHASTVLDLSVQTALAVTPHVVAVVPADAEWAPPVGCVRVDGGATRSASTRCGLAAITSDPAIVVVHDGARPLCTADLYASVIAAVRAGADAAVPALAVSDTVKRIAGSRVVATVSRDDLVTVQTPQAFRCDVLRRAHSGGDDATDDAGSVERSGGVVVVVPGEPRNIKITVRDDLAIAQALLEENGG
jgi:2-C-methyl-D-erythritol 4-phosphate cytidylyltransferase